MMDADELFENAQRLFMKGRYKESIGRFTEALEAGYEPAISYLSRGVTYLKINESEQAVRDFDKAIEIDGRDAGAYYYRGTAFMLEEDYMSAICDFSKAIERNPDHRAAILARGVSYVNLGREEEGARDIKQSMRYVEAALQGFSDMKGWRTRLDKVLSAIERDRGPRTADLTEEDINTLRHWLLQAA